MRILRWRTEVFRGRRGIFFVLVIIIAFAVEIFRTFVFMRRTDLNKLKSDLVFEWQRRFGWGKANILISRKRFSHITGGEFIKFFVVTKDDNSDIY